VGNNAVQMALQTNKEARNSKPVVRQALEMALAKVKMQRLGPIMMANWTFSHKSRITQ
jgi:hypothetical protein